MMLRPSPPPVRLQRTEELRKVDDREYRKRALSVAVCECCCVNYRTTDEIRRRAVALLENIAVDDLDDGHDEVQRYRSLSHGPKPIETKAEGLEKAFAAVSETPKEWRDPDQEKSQTFCVVASCERNRDALKLHLQSEGVRTVTEQGAVYLSTMHRGELIKSGVGK